MPLLTAAQEVELAKRIERGEHASEAGDGGGEPAPRRLDREALPQPGPPVPRPDPGGDDRPRPRRREVRLPQGLQVLDLRDLVDPPGGRARARRQGAHDPDAGARGREAEQDRPHGAHAARRSSAASRARSRSANELDLQPEEIDQIRRSAQTPISLEKPVGDEDESEFGHFLTDESAPLPDEMAEETLRNEALRRSSSRSRIASAGCSSCATASTASSRARSTRSAARSTSRASGSGRSRTRPEEAPRARARRAAPRRRVARGQSRGQSARMRDPSRVRCVGKARALD